MATSQTTTKNDAHSTLFLHIDEFLEMSECLTDCELGQVIRAWLRFGKDGEEPNFKDRALRCLYLGLKQQTMRDRERLETKRQNGGQGGRPKKSDDNSG